MKFADQTGITELITLTKTALKPLEAFKNSVTDVNGIVKSNGSGGFSAAVAGRDYAAASHTHSYLPLTGGTLTGNLTGKYITGTWLQTTATGDKAGKFATIDNDGWIYYRTPAETLADIGAASASHTHTTSQVEGLSDAIAEAEPFVVTIQITTSSGGGKTYTADKTYAEIKAAIDAGKCCYAITTGLEMNILFPALVSSVGVLFTATQPDSASSVVMAILSDSSIIVQTYSAQPLIEVTGLLKGDGQGTISAAVAGIDYAAASHNHSASNITSGTISIARGGTGATNASSALSNLGAVPKSGGTMTGPLVAQTNTSYTTAQMRNVIISTADPSGGNNGDIWLKYEA